MWDYKEDCLCGFFFCVMSWFWSLHLPAAVVWIRLHFTELRVQGEGWDCTYNTCFKRPRWIQRDRRVHVSFHKFTAGVFYAFICFHASYITGKWTKALKSQRRLAPEHGPVRSFFNSKFFFKIFLETNCKTCIGGGEQDGFPVISISDRLLEPF